MTEDNYAQADLRFLLPVREQQHVLVIGEAPALVRQLQEIAHVTTLLDWEACFSLPAHSFNHVFVLHLPHRVREQLRDGLEYLLCPEGWGCVALQNSQSLRTLRFWKRASNHRKEPSARFSFKEAQQLFTELQGIYGVYQTLDNPQYFVPLMNPTITRFFLARLITPATASTRLMISILLILTHYRLHYLIFHDMILIVKKPLPGF